jgi:hypothetical protein
MTIPTASLPISFQDHARTRSESLHELIATLREFPDDGERSAFGDLFGTAQVTLELDDAELSKLLKVSRPTIGRWVRGESSPHPIGRKPIFVALAKVAKAKLSHYSMDARAA